MDIMLKGEMTGIEAANIIHTRYEIPVIFLSAKDLTVDKVRGIELGAAAYITKPFELDKLTDIISAILED